VIEEGGESGEGGGESGWVMGICVAMEERMAWLGA